MLAFYMDLLNHYELPKDDLDYLVETGSKILTEYETKMIKIIDTYYDTDFDTEAVKPLLKDLAESSKVSIFTLNFVFLAVSGKRMKASYKKRGLSEKLFWETIIDLKYKLYESKEVKGVLGIFPIEWYPIFYKLNIFKLGRLEFEKWIFDKKSYSKNGIRVNKGDHVFSVHIPSSGPLTKEMCYESYRLAYEFFQLDKSGKPLVCICDSWLLYEDNKNIFSPKSNLVRFMEDWDIVSNEVDEKFSDAWRIFGVDYDGNPNHLPQGTSLQKSVVKWLKKDGKLGEGYGILIFDGEKIVNKNIEGQE